MKEENQKEIENIMIISVRLWIFKDWVLKSKIFGQKSIYSKETVVV